jgi:uncharacterized membrane protein
MRKSRLIMVLILGIVTCILLGVAVLATGLQYYYRTIAYVLAGVLFFTYIYLIRTRNKGKQRTPSQN